MSSSQPHYFYRTVGIMPELPEGQPDAPGCFSVSVFKALSATAENWEPVSAEAAPEEFAKAARCKYCPFEKTCLVEGASRAVRNIPFGKKFPYNVLSLPNCMRPGRDAYDGCGQPGIYGYLSFPDLNKNTLIPQRIPVWIGPDRNMLETALAAARASFPELVSRIISNNCLEFPFSQSPSVR